MVWVRWRLLLFPTPQKKWFNVWKTWKSFRFSKFDTSPEFQKETSGSRSVQLPGGDVCSIHGWSFPDASTLDAQRCWAKPTQPDLPLWPHCDARRPKATNFHLIRRWERTSPQNGGPYCRKWMKISGFPAGYITQPTYKGAKCWNVWGVKEKWNSIKTNLKISEMFASSFLQMIPVEYFGE